MPDCHLTQAMIEDGMARAEKVAGRPTEDRCYQCPDRLEAAWTICTPQGRCKIGWIASSGGRDSWDMWSDVNAGEGRLQWCQKRRGNIPLRSHRDPAEREEVALRAAQRPQRPHLNVGNPSTGVPAPRPCASSQPAGTSRT